MKGAFPMNDMLISRRAEVEAEAKRRGVDVKVLAAQFEQVLGRRFDVPMTMRAQSSPAA
jgi:hypothetical protein